MTSNMTFDLPMQVPPVTTGTIDIDNYPILRNFDNLWSKIEQDNYLESGRNYYNHIATWYGPVNYRYTGIEHIAQDMPTEFTEIARDLEIENLIAQPDGYYNGLLINSFRNKGIGAHADDEPIFRCSDGTIGAVATISLGGTAYITISRNDRSEPTWSFETTNGDFYLMPDGDFQNKYKHSASKSITPRISLTFRHIP